MAVTPILESINAFDVTLQKYEEVIDGTTIYYCAIASFYASGDVNFIRSNKITIYDSETNEIKATNIYNSTSLINKIPTNLDGISNGKYYYATIEVFDQINGGGNLLGVSNAKQFWCLPSPILTITHPLNDVQGYEYPYYNFIANFKMYPDEYIELSSRVTNRIQSYQFDLYKGAYSAAVLEQSSGVIFNTGSIIDNNTYTINNVFSNLENAVTYFVKIIITTEHGMTAEITSPTLNISTIPLNFNIANITNKSCDGYIEIQSNITNITGYTNANYNVGDGYIDLTQKEKYLIWGYNPNMDIKENSITFPYNNDGDIIKSEWSLLISGRAFNASYSSPVDIYDQSYILEMKDYNSINSGRLYYRDDGVNVWVEFYVFNPQNINADVVYVKSNMLSKANITTNTNLYILIRCSNGWYDIIFADSL